MKQKRSPSMPGGELSPIAAPPVNASSEGVLKHVLTQLRSFGLPERKVGQMTAEIVFGAWRTMATARFKAELEPERRGAP